MNQLKRRTELLLLAVALCMIITAIVHVYSDAQLMFVLSSIINILVMCCLFSFLTLTYKQLITAKLIIDNRILFMEQAQIISENRGIQSKVSEKDVSISCFGILLGSKLIKFNQGGISLKAVELGETCLSFTFGIEGRIQKIRILHDSMRLQDMIRISEKLRYETGITPILTDD